MALSKESVTSKNFYRHDGITDEMRENWIKVSDNLAITFITSNDREDDEKITVYNEDLEVKKKINPEDTQKFIDAGFEVVTNSDNAQFLIFKRFKDATQKVTAKTLSSHEAFCKALKAKIGDTIPNPFLTRWHLQTGSALKFPDLQGMKTFFNAITLKTLPALEMVMENVTEDKVKVEGSSDI